MKKYLKVSGTLWQQDEITREDLMRAKDRSYDFIINTIDSTYFDPNKNKWMKIKGEL